MLCNACIVVVEVLSFIVELQTKTRLFAAGRACLRLLLLRAGAPALIDEDYKLVALALELLMLSCQDMAKSRWEWKWLVLSSESKYVEKFSDYINFLKEM